MAGWAIPMGSQVSVEAKLERHREARRAVMGVDAATGTFVCTPHSIAGERRKHGADAVGLDIAQPDVIYVGGRRFGKTACCGDPSDCTESCP